MAGSGYPGVAQLVARLLWEQDAGSSSLPTRTTSERNPLHSVSRRSLLGAALKLRSAPLLLLSNSNPLRWASSWLWCVMTVCIFFINTGS